MITTLAVILAILFIPAILSAHSIGYMQGHEDGMHDERIMQLKKLRKSYYE